MSEQRRRAYLRAMGVTLWAARRRDPHPAASSLVRPTRTAASAADGLAVLRRDALAPAAPDAVMAAAVDPAIPTQSDPPQQAATALPLLPAPSAPVAAIGEMDWDALRQAVAGCRACGLCETRTRTVFGVGNQRADLVVIGEAPGAEEDRQGEPFVGRAGQLLTRMLGAIGLAREQVFIANILKCRPPGNRDPRPEESLACRAHLSRQLALIQPQIILAVGRVAAQNLLGTEEAIGRLRGRWLEYGAAGTPLRVTYHPAYLLRSPEQKAKAWEDLTEVWRRLQMTAASVDG